MNVGDWAIVGATKIIGQSHVAAGVDVQAVDGIRRLEELDAVGFRAARWRRRFVGRGRDLEGQIERSTARIMGRPPIVVDWRSAGPRRIDADVELLER